MPNVLRQRLAKLSISFFYVGFCPFAPGTVASFLGLILVAIAPGGPLGNVLGLILLLALGLWATSEYAKQNPEEDPAENVIDEVIGIWVTFLFVERTFWPCLIGFLLFRVYDILKPFGIRRLENFRTPWGIVLDDVLAGVYANLTIRLIGILFR